MKEDFSIGWLIKRYIKIRNHTMKEVADILGIKYTTFSGRIVRGDIDANLLFQLANLLDIDLGWMAQLFDKHRYISKMDKYQLSRMNSDFRASERKSMLPVLDKLIKDNPNSITDVKNELLSHYHNQLFYILDVLLPEDYLIQIEADRNEREKYYCLSTASLNTPPYPIFLMRSRRSVTQFCDGNDMLKRIIIDRKDEI